MHHPNPYGDACPDKVIVLRCFPSNVVRSQPDIVIFVVSFVLFYHRLTCIKGCDQKIYLTGATIKMTCTEKPCYNVAWYIESNGWQWPVSPME